MKKIIIFIISLILFSGCVFFIVPFETRDNFKYCLIDNNNRIDTLLKVNGIFYSGTINSYNDFSKTINNKDLFPNFIFYNNGFCTENPPPIWYLNTQKGNVHLSSYNHGSTWGLYSIHGDTIKTQFISKPGAMDCTTKERWFLIIDSITVKQIWLSYYEPVSSKEVNTYLKMDDTSKIKIFKFHCLDSLPDPNKSWIIDKKWFWCNKQDYKEWKRKGSKRNVIVFK